MKILALEHELAATGYTPELLRAEALAVWALVKAGVVRETYFKKEPKEAVLVLECASLEVAREHLAALPLVQAGLIEFETAELVPYDGFERLFG